MVSYHDLVRTSILTLAIQHGTGVLSGTTKRKNKMHKDQKGRNKTIPICIWYDFWQREFQIKQNSQISKNKKSMK